MPFARFPLASPPRRTAAPKPAQRARALALAALALTACSAERQRSVGAFLAELSEDGATLTVSLGGEVVVRTAPGLARFRSAAASYEMQYGAFDVVERPGALDVRAARADGFDGDALPLLDAGGAAVGTLTLAEVQGSLHITARADSADANRAALLLACDAPADGDYLGFGAQTHDVDHRGQNVPIWVSEQGIGKTDDDAKPTLWPLVGTRHSSYFPVPSLIAPRAGRSYGLRATTLERSVWDVCKADPGTLSVEAWESAVTVEVAPGPTPLDVMAQQSAIAGRRAVGPDWTFGVWMEAVGGRDFVLAEAARLRAAGVPASAMWTEDWRGGHPEGRGYALDEDWRADDRLYPDLDGMIAQLHADGFRFMTYFNTFVVKDADVWAESIQNDYLVNSPDGTPSLFQGLTFEDTGLADLYRPAPRAFVVQELQRALARGIDGWMADFAEWYPAEARQVAPPAGLSAPAAHQLYAVEWAKANQEAVAASGRDDVVIFHRSGYSGSQPYVPVVWVGDQRTSFDADDGLPTVVPLMLGLSVTGFPVVTHDIGGYISSTNPPTTKDLFYRWTTLGALTPVMRTHHGRDATANWRWDRDGETRAHFVRWAQFHQQRVPHWIGLARDAADTGAPILRPLAFADPADARLAGVRDEYLIGDDYLVAPVLTASTAHRTVILPRGLWYPLATPLMPVEGPAEVEVDVPLTAIAVFARAGAIIPLIDAELPTLNGPEAARILDGARVVEVWLGADGRSRDARGGTWTLTSAARPSSPFFMVEGATDVRAQVVGELRCSAPANGTVTLRADDGGVHTVVAAGHAPGMRVQYLIHY